MKFIFTSFITLIFFCNMNPQSMSAFVNGKIYTGNPEQPYVETVIIGGSKIVYTGSADGASELMKQVSNVIDLEGRLMLPGFIDAHTHFFNGGFYLTGIDLRPARSEEEFKVILKEYSEKYPGKWITGGYWDHEKWASKKMPVKELLDDAVAGTPVFVDRIDGHVAAANSIALKLAGITKDSKDPEGGKIEKHPVTGEPTGILKDNAMDLVQSLIPPWSAEDYMQAGIAASEHLARNGITGIHDITQVNEFSYIKQLESKGILHCRVYSRLPLEHYSTAAGIRDDSASSLLVTTGSLKAYADGSLGASTAWFFEPYEGDTSNRGLANDIILNGKFEEWSFNADLEKLQLCTHAIGDRANYYTLQVYKKIKEKNPPRDRRFRIEHAQHVRPEDIHLFTENKVIASVQPYHAIDDGVWAERRVGKERVSYTHPYKSFLDNNVLVAFGTDWPIAPVNPLEGIYAAVTRHTVDDKNSGGWIPGQKISVEDAVKCYTINNAYAGFQEDITGTIETGKSADFVVLSEDIFSIDPVQIKDAAVEMTVFLGEIVYKK